MLLSKGIVKYYGPAGEAAASLETLGFPCPKEYHIADHLLVVASNDDIDAKSTSNTDVNLRHRNVTKSSESPSVDRSNSYIKLSTTDSALMKASKITQLQCVFSRSLKIFLRNPVIFFSHLLLSVGLGFFIGFLYFGIDSTLGGIQNRLGSIFFLQSLIGFAGLSAISTIDSDKTLFIRERSNGFYGYFPYFVCKVLFDIIPLRIIPTIVIVTISYFLIGFNPAFVSFLRFLVIMILFSINCGLYCMMIGCAFDGSPAILIASITMLFQMLFAGILVNQEEIPVSLKWIQYFSFFKYAYEACVANDADGLKLVDRLGGITFTIPASAILEKFGLDVNAYFRDLLVCIALIVGFLIAIALIMKFRLTQKK